MKKKTEIMLKSHIKKMGSQNQIDQAIEELSELILALAKHKRYNDLETCKDVIVEIADCKNMLNQLSIIFGKEQVKEHLTNGG